MGRNLSWTPDGAEVAFFGRFQKRRALLFADVVESRIVRRIEMPLDRAKFPHVGPDGEWVYFTALNNAISDVYRVNIATEEIENLTRDDFHDKFPTVSRTANGSTTAGGSAVTTSSTACGSPAARRSSHLRDLQRRGPDLRAQRPRPHLFLE